MAHSGDYDFSFSGLKTAVSLYWGELSDVERQRNLPDIVASFQEAAVDILVQKTTEAAKDAKVKTVTLSGGVAANSRLREILAQKLEQCGLQFLYPEPSLCTDNAAMIAVAGYFQFRTRGASPLEIDCDPSLRLG